MKRLFLFAAYDRTGHVDTSLVHYVRALSKLGDVIVCMDNDATDTELKKLSPYTIYAMAERHREYDFGSYKRAYTYARNKHMLRHYDIVYMVNDSVYGPLFDLKPLICEMENKNLDAFGPVCNPHRDHPHIQSWFVGMRKSVFLSSWFDQFITSVTHEQSKGLITQKYEQGLTKRVATHGLKWGCTHEIPGRGIYNNVKKIYRMGVPFIKKVAFSRHGGTYGRQIKYVLNHCDENTRTAILTAARNTYGNEYIDWLLTRNPFKIFIRGTKTGMHKIYSGTL